MMADDDLQKRLATWARQTIAFAICLKAQADGKPVDDAMQVGQAGEAVERTASELWADTAKECPQRAPFTMTFARKVLDRVEDHQK
jgi:hypothetical protein